MLKRVDSVLIKNEEEIFRTTSATFISVYDRQYCNQLGFFIGSYGNGSFVELYLPDRKDTYTCPVSWFKQCKVLESVTIPDDLFVNHIPLNQTLLFNTPTVLIMEKNRMFEVGDYVRIKDAETILQMKDENFELIETMKKYCECIAKVEDVSGDICRLNVGGEYLLYGWKSAWLDRLPVVDLVFDTTNDAQRSV